MDKSIISLLTMIRDNHGEEVFADREGRLLKTFLADYAKTDYKSEISCLCTAFKEGVYHELKEKKALTKVTMQKYITKFEKVYFWNHDASVFAVNTWAEFLGLSPLESEPKEKPDKVKTKKATASCSSLPIDGHISVFGGDSINIDSISAEECFVNSDSWLKQAEKSTDKAQKTKQYQMAFLEVANVLRIYDSKKTSIKEYFLALIKLKRIYKNAVRRQDKTDRLKFQAGLKSSALKAYIPKQYRDLSTRKYRYILMMFLFIISAFMATWGRVYTVDFPYISDRIVILPYLVSVMCMTYILWLFLPNILKRLLLNGNMAFIVIVVGALGGASMFIHSQIILWLITLLKSLS